MFYVLCSITSRVDKGEPVDLVCLDFQSRTFSNIVYNKCIGSEGGKWGGQGVQEDIWYAGRHQSGR